MICRGDFSNLVNPRPTEDHIEDTVGDELIRRIEEVYLDLNLDFLISEKVDLGAIIDSPSFATIKDFLEDWTIDELIRRIKEAHPDWDISFLISGGSNLQALLLESSRGQVLTRRWR